MNGIYYLANDKVLDWFIASIKSVRAKGTTLPIRVIPFNREISGISGLTSKLGFEIWEDPQLEQLDTLGKQFDQHANGYGMFRKFACFWGPFDNFAYMDVDIVALMNWDELVTSFVEKGDDFWFFSSSGWGVYQPGPFWDKLKLENRTFVFNAGAWVSRRGLFDLEALRLLAKEAEPVQDQFCNSGDQAFLNYCVDFSPVAARMASDVVPMLRPFNWAKSEIEGYSDYFNLADRDGTWRGKRFSSIHWAGIGLGPQMPYADLFLKYRLSGMSAFERARFMWNWKNLK